MRVLRLYSCAFSAAVLLAAIACGGSSGGSSTPPTAPSTPAPAPTPTTTISYSGIFASGTFTGTASVTADVPVTVTASGAGFRPLATVSATGSAKFTGASQLATNLTGTYDMATSTFALRGGQFTVDATVADNALAGTIKTSVGTAALAALPSGSSTSPTSYCGTFRGSSTGKFNIVLNGTVVRGVAAQDGEPEAIHLKGTASGSTVSLSWGHGDFQGAATGTIDGARVDGTWSNSDGERGTWSGNSVGC